MTQPWLPPAAKGVSTAKLNTAARWVRELGAAAGDFLYPPACLWCGDARGESRSLCPECVLRIAPPLPHRCWRCSAPVGPHLDTRAGCIHCQADRFVFAPTVSLGVYQEELGKAARQCKQAFQQPLTMALTSLLVERERSVLNEIGLDAVLPVPHHWTNRWQSRHHAADTVADQLGRDLGLPVERHLVRKVRRTTRQLMLSGRERRENLKAAFQVIGRPRLQGVRLLLADDILTTGTTAQRVAQELLRAGAASVCVAVLGRSLGEGAAEKN